jgi:ribonucleoside-diphosphate reductase alpha chain
LYRPKEIIIDGNGIGGGLIDNMVIPSVGEKGEYYGPLYVINDPENYPIPRGEEKNAIIYNMKATAALNSEIYSNLYVQFNSGNISLLANERIVKEKLGATKKGQRMNLLSREKFLLPYIMTSRLIDEMNNLKLKLTGVAGQVTVEQISKRINKDRVSALGYGLFRIKYYEDKAIRKVRSGLGDLSSAILFSSGKTRRRN